MAACVVSLACLAGGSAALADTYRSGPYTFEIDGLPLDRVQDEVLSAIRLPLTTRGVAQVTRWSATPCYKVGNAQGYVGEETLTAVIAALNARLPYRIEPCLARDKPAVTYFLIGNVFDAADRRELTARRLPPNQLDCDWQQTAIDPETGLITRAIVVARSTASSTSKTRDCLMRNTAETLGAGWPTARIDPGAPTADAEARELNLLSLFVRYRITQELHNFQTLFQVEDRIAALVAEMHQAGILAQSQ
jgi:hypothetical protein